MSDKVIQAFRGECFNVNFSIIKNCFTVDTELVVSVVLEYNSTYVPLEMHDTCVPSMIPYVIYQYNFYSHTRTRTQQLSSP